MNYSQDFIEKLILLVLGALITGFLVPYIFRKRDEQKFRDQKVFEAELARQAKIVEAQVQLLDALTELLWQFLLRALSVSYYQIYKDAEKYRAALKAYDDNSWPFFGDFQVEISKSLRLTSSERYQLLLKFYEDHIIPLDGRLMETSRKEATKQEWSEIHKLINSVGGKGTEVINLLAEEWRLTKVTAYGD